MENEHDLIEENDCTIIIEEEDDGNNLPVALYSLHGTKVMIVAEKGKKKGQKILHFQCNYCREKYFQGPSSSTFLEHLRKVHPKRCSELLPQAKDSKPKRNFFEKANMNLPFDKEVFVGKLLKWIIQTDQPFSVVDTDQFEDMIQYFKKDIVLHSRKTIMRRLEELYIQQKSDLKEKLNSFKSKFSITCDVWTSKNQLSFFGITIHYIDDDWKIQEHLLAFKYLECEHDGLSLSKALIEVLEDYGIADRLLGVTADNASNNKKMMAHVQSYYDDKYPDAGFSVAWNQVECLAHVLNLGAQQILKEFKQPVDKDTYQQYSESNDRMVTAVSRISFLCRKIRKSPKLRRLMESICQQKEVKYLVPIIDVATRWNSTYDMLIRAHELKDVISDTFYQHKDKELFTLVLSDNDWNCIEQLIEVLKPLKEATLLASTNGESLMVTNMLPIYHICTEILKESLSNFNETDDIYIGIEAAIEKLIQYYDKVSPMVGIGLMLDPTMKKDFLRDVLEWEPSWVESVTDHFMSSFKFYLGKANVQGHANSIPTLETGSLLGKFKRRKSAATMDHSEESVRYFNAPLAQDGTNPLLYWKTHQFDFPILAAMAKDYLTVQASSVSSERAFSSGADLVTANRSSLSGKTIEMSQFLKFLI